LRYEISLAPSAALWLRWRRGALRGIRRRALVLADPALLPTMSLAVSEREWKWTPPPAGLPAARSEARFVISALGGGRRVVLGEEASKSFLKTADLTGYGILHLAAHAVVDEKRPERSALLLAGAGEEDGLLQMRDIVGLNLESRAVVLSACRSAGGAEVAG